MYNREILEKNSYTSYCMHLGISQVGPLFERVLEMPMHSVYDLQEIRFILSSDYSMPY